MNSNFFYARHSGINGNENVDQETFKTATPAETPLFYKNIITYFVD